MPGWNYEQVIVTASDALTILKQVRLENPRRTSLAPMAGYKAKFIGWGPSVEFTSKDDPTRKFKSVSVKVLINIGENQREFILSPEAGKDYTTVFGQENTMIQFDIVEDSKGYREMRNIKIDG